MAMLLVRATPTRARIGLFLDAPGEILARGRHAVVPDAAVVGEVEHDGAAERVLGPVDFRHAVGRLDLDGLGSWARGVGVGTDAYRVLVANRLQVAESAVNVDVTAPVMPATSAAPADDRVVGGAADGAQHVCVARVVAALDRSAT